MASQSQNTSPRPWLVPLLVVLTIGLVWTFFSARGAGGRAAANEELLLVPQLDVSYVVGGPQRFQERFAEAREEAEEADASADELRWATLVVANRGRADAEDVTATLSLASGVEPVLLANLSSFGDLEVAEGEEGPELDMSDIDVGETALVFLGFAPDSLADGVSDAWAGGYERTVDRIVAAGDVDSAVYYGTSL